MTLGIIKSAGSATITAGTPGVAGSVAVALTSLLATDNVTVTISSTAAQTTTGYNDKDLTFQVVKTAGTGFTIYSNLDQNKSIVVDYIVSTAAVPPAKVADEDIDGDYITSLELDGTSATVALTNLVAKEIGQEIFLYCSNSTNAVTVACKTGTTFDGTNTLLTMTVGEYAKFRAVSLTQFVEIVNTATSSAP